MVPGKIQNISRSLELKWERKDIACLEKEKVYQVFINDSFFFNLLSYEAADGGKMLCSECRDGLQAAHVL